MLTVAPQPPKRRTTAAAPPPKEKTPRQSALAKEHSISAATESEIKEAFDLFATTSKPKSLPTPSLRRALTALNVPPASATELEDLTDAADPDASGSISYPHFVAVAALKLNSRSDESEAREVEDAFGMFIAQGGGRGGKITAETLKRVARVLKEDVGDDVIRDMMLEANGGAGVGQGVGIGDFEGVMRRAGVFR